MNKFSRGLFICSLISLSALANDEVDWLYDQLEKGDPTALNALQKMALQHDPDALSVLGFTYEYGITQPKNVPHAIDYYQRACEAGGIRGCYNAGYFYHYGIGVPKDNARAKAYFEKINTTDMDDAYLRDVADELYSLKARVDADPRLRAEFLDHAEMFAGSASREDRKITQLIGFGKRDLLRLARLWARDGSPLVNFYVGHFYNFSFSYLGDDERDIEALKWFRKAAEGGESSSQNILGLTYLRGAWGVKSDVAAAITWFERAVKQGDLHAMINLGEIYYRGEIVNPDYGKAFSLFERAYKNHSQSAAGYLSKMYYNGQGVEADCYKSWFYRQKSGPHSFNDERVKFMRICQKDSKLEK